MQRLSDHVQGIGKGPNISPVSSTTTFDPVTLSGDDATLPITGGAGGGIPSTGQRQTRGEIAGRLDGRKTEAHTLRAKLSSVAAAAAVLDTDGHDSSVAASSAPLNQSSAGMGTEDFFTWKGVEPDCKVTVAAVEFTAERIREATLVMEPYPHLQVGNQGENKLNIRTA